MFWDKLGCQVLEALEDAAFAEMLGTSVKVACDWVELCPSFKTPGALHGFENITGASINAEVAGWRF